MATKLRLFLLPMEASVRFAALSLSGVLKLPRCFLVLPVSSRCQLLLPLSTRAECSNRRFFWFVHMSGIRRPASKLIWDCLKSQPADAALVSDNLYIAIERLGRRVGEPSFINEYGSA